MLVARVHKQVPCGSLASVRRTGRGAGPSAGVRATAVLRGNLGERCVEGHEQGEPEAEASTDGPSEGPAEGHAPGRGAAFSLGLWGQGLVQGWGMFSQPHCQEWRSSDSAEKLCCTCAGGKRKDSEMTETLTVRALSGTVLGSGGDADKQNGLLGPVTTAT